MVGKAGTYHERAAITQTLVFTPLQLKVSQEASQVRVGQEPGPWDTPLPTCSAYPMGPGIC